MTAKAVTDLPEPDSPTSATVSPLSTVKPTWSRTFTVPERVRNSTESSSTASAGTADTAFRSASAVAAAARTTTSEACSRSRAACSASGALAATSAASRSNAHRDGFLLMRVSLLLRSVRLGGVAAPCAA